MIDWNSKELENTLYELLQEIDRVAQKNGWSSGFKFGQKEAVLSLYDKLKKHGAILADEVGLGKTRVALIIMEAVLRAGGSVAAVVPSGLMFQWEEEAQKFSDFLEKSCITKNIVRLSGFNDLFSQVSSFSGEDISYPLSQNDGVNCRWPLISHNFGPILANTKSKENYAFFEYLGYLLETKMDGKKWSRYINNFSKNNESKIEQAIQYLAPLKNQSKLKNFNVNVITRIISKKKKKDCKWTATKTENQYIEDRKIIEETSRYVIKELVGNIDFLVIDEAHKGKSSIDEKEEQDDCFDSIDEIGEEKVSSKKNDKRKTRIAALLDETLNIDSNGRKLCMTATPVELTTDNWIQILKRCGEKKVDQSIFNNFHNSLHDFKCHPTNDTQMELLEKASRNFTETLQDYVVRRLRSHQEEYKGLVKNFKYGDAAHIHRLSKSENIVLQPGSNWQKAIMSLEGVAWAAKGLRDNSTENIKMRSIQSRYPTGCIEISDGIESIDLKSIKDPKKQRMKFWEMQANAFIKTSKNTEINPRITQTADLIEKILEKNECQFFLDKECEKVLVFGTFTKPMEELRDELNRRNYVHRVISKKLIQNNVNDISEKERIYSTYVRLYDERKLNFEQLRLPQMTFEAFFEQANKWHNEYIRYREGVLSIIHDKNETLASDFDKQEKIDFGSESHDFNEIIFFKTKYKEKTTKKTKIYDSIIELLKNDLLNWLIDDYDYAVSDDSEKNVFNKRSFMRQKLKILARGFFQDLKDSTKGNKKKKAETQDCKIRDNDIIKYIKESGNQFGDYYSSKFCRLMNGDTEGNTRRRLQRQFNTSRMSPKVLIAQSLVGREGLNLHKCCRNVVLLHPEWNPGTVEQEIGRVDRIDSLWNRLAEKWQENNPQGESEQNQCPRINVYYMVFEGTYDQSHFEVLKARINDLNAQLFGSLLETNEQIPDDIAQRLKAAAPDFDPCKK